ncbi:hypothetical protein JW926_05705 [Candidatus Sumerlaeota bacterium]|nr:hypothetical protein [Candidatus Sumerlaeota bacterium]
MKVNRQPLLRCGAILLFLFGTMSLYSQDAAVKETPVINMQYESWRNSSPEDIVIYKLKPESGEEPEILEIKILEIKLDKYDFQTRKYVKERLIEEKRESFSLKDMNRYYKTAELNDKGIMFSESRETIAGSVYPSQKLQYPDGSVEIYCDRIPAGGLYKKLNPAGEAIRELLETKHGSKRTSMVTELEGKKGKPHEIKTGALTVSELMKGLHQGQRTTSQPDPDKKKVVIGNIGKQPEEESVKAETFLEEVALQKGKASDKFSRYAPVLVAGFDRPKASALFHLIETIEPVSGEREPSPIEIRIIYSEYIPPQRKGYGNALFTLIVGDDITTTLVRLRENPFPDMKEFELPPEAVSIIPGSFDCYHVRLVSPKPEVSVEEQDGYQITTIRDAKIDYWISNIQDSTVALKKTFTEREQIIKVSRDGSSNAPETIDRTKVKKWTLVEFKPGTE